MRVTVLGRRREIINPPSSRLLNAKVATTSSSLFLRIFLWILRFRGYITETRPAGGGMIQIVLPVSSAFVTFIDPSPSFRFHWWALKFSFSLCPIIYIYRCRQWEKEVNYPRQTLGDYFPFKIICSKMAKTLYNNTRVCSIRYTL